jgi:endonuclease YncB( thermonuclease family)
VLGLLLATILAACNEVQDYDIQQLPSQTMTPQDSTPEQSHSSRTAVVTRVVDGDTVDVELGHRQVRIRLIGVDTPEVYFGVECFGPEASVFTKAKLDGASVRLEFDVDRIDPYGRTLGYVWLKDRLFNRTLVAKGYATVATYPPNVKYEDLFVAAEQRARYAGRGLWATCAA